MSKVTFCPKCGNNFSNFYLEEINGVSVLSYKCNTCLYSLNVSPEEQRKNALLFSKNNINNKPDRILNSDMCMDASLPRSSTIKCPNEKCPSNTDKNKEPEVVKVEYNNEKAMAYICCYPECHSKWK